MATSKNQLSAQKIREGAISKGSTQSRLSFLKSEAVARAVAVKAKAYLVSHGVRDGNSRVKVERCPLRKGTWSVVVFLPGVLRVGTNREASVVHGMNEADAQKAVDALRASYDPAKDLVQVWSWPSKR